MPQPQRLLVVEDDPQMRQLLRKALVREGYDVVSAEDGVQALETLANDDAFDLIVTDIRMPRMDGEKLLAELHQKHPQFKVVLMTAYAELDQYMELMRAGAVDYLPKPFKIPDLLAVVERSIGPPPAAS